MKKIILPLILFGICLSISSRESYASDSTPNLKFERLAAECIQETPYEDPALYDMYEGSSLKVYQLVSGEFYTSYHNYSFVGYGAKSYLNVQSDESNELTIIIGSEETRTIKLKVIKESNGSVVIYDKSQKMTCEDPYKTLQTLF